MSTDEPRALTAALQSPAFVTKGGALAMHVANRHVERWAPEQGASRSRPLRNLGFVDRLVSPWLESAQRSASLRMFTRHATQGMPERAASNVSWVFPRPWYQDELDWMAAARQVGMQSAQEAPAPNLLTTRGTYVAPTQPRSALALPSALFEYVAPSLSVARPELQATSEPFSPLVSFAASQAAHVMSRAVAPLATSDARLSPGLRAVLTTMLSRATRAPELAPTRASLTAPELVTPPAPRPESPTADEPAMQVAERYAEQHAQLADVQRMARVAAERELAARLVASTPPAQPEARDQRQAEIQRRVAASRQETLRLHEQSRDAAARDAVTAPATTPVLEPRAVEQPREHRVAAEIAAAVSALPPELAAIVSAGISARPERAVQAIAELGVALRSAELIARNTAAGGTIEPTRGPRVVMPAGLGGLVSTVERTSASDHAQPAPMVRTEMRMPAMPFLQAPRTIAATSALGAAAATMPAALSHVAWSDRWLARFAGARPQSLELLAAAASPETRMQLLAQAAPNAVFVAPMFEDRSDSEAEVGFAGTRPQDVLPTLRGGVAPAQPVVRFADDAETPDDMFAAIAFSASRSRSAAASPTPPRPALPSVDPDRYQSRDTLADLVAHLAPSAPGAGLSAQLASSPFAPALRHLVSLGVAPGFDVRALFGAGLSATYLAGLVSSATAELPIAMPEMITRSAVEFEPTYVAPTEAPEHIDTEPLTTLRSALLSFTDVETHGGPAETTHAPLARTMIESLARPMLGESAWADEHATTHAAPGMVAERAQAWSVAQERSSSDLAFDFIPPELVLAARIYGLGPAEAAQAARLAVAGPGQLTAMASAVDRTFVQAMAIEAERRGERTQMVTAYPIAAGESGPPTDAMPRGAAAPMTFAPAQSTFGVERRTPRGAFLWPAATSAALGLTAAAPDGEQSMPLAALELLAAQAVAELGTYAALGDHRTAVGDARVSESAEQRDDDVLASASALVPTARRDKFQALYVALSQSPTGRTWSPAARAARALALAGRGEDSVSARERATVAWDVLPVVYGIDAESESLSTGELAERTARRREELRTFDPMFVDARPGLAGLSTRAGEALGSYVAAPAGAPSSSSSSREVGAVLRAPTAAPELVQTGRPASRSGGGEVEIPAWFEQAARKMFESKSNLSDGISLAELTLVSAAPAAQIAASSRVSSAPPVTAAPTAAVGSDKEQIDIEKVANDVYREVLVLMDLARARNGEPYL